MQCLVQISIKRARLSKSMKIKKLIKYYRTRDFIKMATLCSSKNETTTNKHQIYVLFFKQIVRKYCNESPLGVFERANIIYL